MNIEPGWCFDLKDSFYCLKSLCDVKQHLWLSVRQDFKTCSQLWEAPSVSPSVIKFCIFLSAQHFSEQMSFPPWSLSWWCTPGTWHLITLRLSPLLNVIFFFVHLFLKIKKKFLIVFLFLNYENMMTRLQRLGKYRTKLHMWFFI